MSRGISCRRGEPGLLKDDFLGGDQDQRVGGSRSCRFPQEIGLKTNLANVSKLRFRDNSIIVADKYTTETTISRFLHVFFLLNHFSNAQRIRSSTQFAPLLLPLAGGFTEKC